MKFRDLAIRLFPYLDPAIGRAGPPFESLLRRMSASAERSFQTSAAEQLLQGKNNSKVAPFSPLRYH
ncbi:hypothetical protein E0H35_37300 [Rhizobium leguminosarum bv. viciae]|uniref:hypothetical protein n=1 Tax=Rhizobium TaxID=379 RepID=UPI00103FC20E|nr:MULTISPECIES: hypothetical protein [Rhizobium]MBB4346277.1 hypothetical protein [Rhizobium leguminosarum]MBY5856220.1 hypothetical protein [Rhizobium leguminosarum]MDX5999948.1 hypothetical protein [Rhizobium leguminosarum]NEI25141.1 hypothetical protein [Rhizobium ruizarguesonis]NEI32333.1 hypothetical protein [Rhizobium ruizarguesonis]